MHSACQKLRPTTADPMKASVARLFLELWEIVACVQSAHAAAN